MKPKRANSTKYLSHEEQSLLYLYLIEYNDIFQYIYIQTPREFIKNVIKRVELTLKNNLTTFQKKLDLK